MQKMILFLCCLYSCILFASEDQEGGLQSGVPIYQVGDNQAIKNWLLSDPIPLPAHLSEQATYGIDFLQSIGGEQNSIPTESITVHWDQQEYRFTRYQSDQDIINLAKIYPKDQQVAYAFCFLESDKEQDVYLHMGSDDGYSVFLNHAEIWNYHKPRGVRKNTDVVAVHLQKGKNSFLVKNHNGTGGWGFVVEVLDLPHHLAAIFDTKLQIGYTRTGRMGRQLSLSPRSDHSYLGKHPDLFMPVTWRIFDLDRRLITERNGDFFSETHLRLPVKEGLYEIEMELPTLDQISNQRRSGLILAENIPQFVSDHIRQAEAFVEQEAEKNYAGWVAYAKYLVKSAIEKNGIDHAITATELIRLSHAKQDAHADVLPKRTGIFEWAYYSGVDGSGQPFRIAIPETYDPHLAYPLVLVMHGAGGRHMPENAPERENYSAPVIRVGVLGRSRYGMYQQLSEVDVLECLAYVQKHWHIDPQQIHLEGGSMGGGGVFKLASRFPQLFATGILSAGFGTDIEVGNLLHIPLYSLHSKDDPTVSITSSRTPLDALVKAGGEVVKYETDGWQHAIWQDRDAFVAAHLWREGRRQPEKIEHIRFTAVDELSRQAYWAKILEWGDRPEKASFEIRVDPNQQLRLELYNIGTLALNLQQAPVDKHRNMEVFVSNQSIGRISAPLPDVVYLVKVGYRYQLTSQKPDDPPQRRHFTGGAGNLYHGEPLLIVWGTQGDHRMDETLQNAALSAGRSPNTSWWPEEAGEPFNQMLFAQVRVKADLDVTPEDMQKYNLLLLGTPATNAVVRQLADRLPVQFKDGQLVLSDGLSYNFHHRAMGLLYFNPVAPQRYIYLASSDDPEFYRAETPLMTLQAKRPSFFDFALMSSRGQTLVSGRHFQPNWNWEKGYRASGLIPEELCLASGLNRFKAEALIKIVGSDFVVLEPSLLKQPLFSKGESRWMDLAGAQDPERAVTISLSGRELIEEWDKLEAGGNSAYYLYPQLDRKVILPEQLYEICFPTGRMLWYYQRFSKRDISTIKLTEITVGEAIKRAVEHEDGER